MINLKTYIPKGKQLLFFNQPEITPIKLKVAESKKKGDDVVRCYEVGKNKKKTRLYTIDKLKTMDSYDKYKLESSPEIATKTHQTDTFKISLGSQHIKFDLNFEQTSDNNIISVYRKTFEVDNIVFVNKEENSESEINFSSIMLHAFSQDSLLENFNDVIEKRFSNNYIEIIED